MGGAGAASHVPGASGSRSWGAGEAASSETLPRLVCTTLARGSMGQAVHGASVAMLSPCPAVPPALVRAGLLQGPGAGAPHAGDESWGAGWVQGDFGDALALFLLEGERFDAGLGGGTRWIDTKAAAPRFLHGRGCLEESLWRKCFVNGWT